MPLTILAHGAWIASLGLALSVWIRRESRAISLVAAAYVLYVIAIPIAAIVLAGPGGNGPFSSIAPVLASSPVFAAIQIVESLTTRQVNTTNALLWIAFWDLIAAGAALGLLWRPRRCSIGNSIGCRRSGLRGGMEALPAEKRSGRRGRRQAYRSGHGIGSGEVLIGVA